MRWSIAVRPWQLKQFELFQAVTVSTSSRQQFTQEYLIISGQSGTVSSFQYRNAPASGQITEGKLLVIEPGETWISQVKDNTSNHLFIDPVWLQQFATEQLHWEQSLPHFPSQTFSDPSLSRTMHDLAANSLATDHGPRRARFHSEGSYGNEIPIGNKQCYVRCWAT